MAIIATGGPIRDVQIAPSTRGFKATGFAQISKKAETVAAKVVRVAMTTKPDLRSNG